MQIYEIFYPIKFQEMIIYLIIETPIFHSLLIQDLNSLTIKWGRLSTTSLQADLKSSPS